ncbi:GNAT family N-acetyltransferase [Aerococcaceae bacterium WGS1372]
MKFQSHKIDVRLAEIKDAQRVKEIITPYIEGTVLNLEEIVGPLEYYEQLILESTSQLPFFVAEYNNEVVGFVYVSELSYMLNLTNTCALSIYVANDASVKGVGKSLLSKLEEALSRAGVQQIIANIVTTNIKSIQFHKRNGFQLLSTFPQAGYKFGQWHDVQWFGKKLDVNNHIQTESTEASLLSLVN